MLGRQKQRDNAAKPGQPLPPGHSNRPDIYRTDNLVPPASPAPSPDMHRRAPDVTAVTGDQADALVVLERAKQSNVDNWLKTHAGALIVNWFGGPYGTLPPGTRFSDVVSPASDAASTRAAAQAIQIACGLIVVTARRRVCRRES